MSNKVFIHIGLHKTGSTYLQDNVFPFIKDINYSFGRDLNNFLLDGDVSIDKNTLLSWEGMSGDPIGHETYKRKGKPLEEGYLDSFYRRTRVIKSLFPEAEIIIFCRKHGDFLSSVYKQYVKRGGWLSFEDFKNHPETPCFKTDNEFSIQNKINFLSSLFDNVHVYDHADLLKTPHLVVEDLCKRMDAHFDFELPMTRSNEGLKEKKLEYRRSANFIFYKLPRIIRQLLILLSIKPSKISNWGILKLFTLKKQDSTGLERAIKSIDDQYTADELFFQSIKINVK